MARKDVSSAPRKAPDDHAWEREHAPHPSSGHVYAAVGVYSLWLVFLGGMGVHRWFLTLQ